MVNITEFEAFNKETGRWEIFSISQYTKIKRDGRYEPIVIDERGIYK